MLRSAAPFLAGALAFCACLSLGVWQLHRLAWKEGIIAQIRTAQSAAPVALPDTPGPFEKVFATGSWVPGKAALYGQEVHDTPSGPVSGGELIMPLRRPSGQILLVDLGWVPQSRPAPVAAPPRPAGYIHAAIHRTWLSPPDDPVDGLFYTLDPAAIGAGLGLGQVAPYLLIATGPPPPPGSPAPQPAQDLPTPVNNHYEYALTWFGFAGLLVFECLILVRKRLLNR